MRIVCFIFLAVVSLLTTSAAVTLNLSHASLPQDTNTVLVHTISGLAVGEKVTVERIADLNNNGSADPTEPSQRTFSVTDGGRSTIGGVVNGNVPGDDDATANGTIRVDLNFPGVDLILGRQAGRYIVRVTGPSGTHTQSFEILARSLPQRFTGVVRNDSTGAPVPYALVVALVGDGVPLGSVRADANGVYSYAASAGDYTLLPFADGLMGAFTPVSLAAGETKTENLSLQPAAIRISGRVVDSVTQAGLASMFVFGENEAGEIAGALTDSSGNYSFNVLPGEWAIMTLADFAAQTGHIPGEDEFITAVSSPITVDIALIPANALAHGRITDASGAPIQGLLMEAYGENPVLSSDFEFESAGRTTANGDYWIGLAGGSNSQWYYGVGEDPNAAYLPVQFSASPAVGQAILANSSLKLPSARITGFLRNSANQPLANIGLHASATIDNVEYSIDTNTDSTGSYSFPAINGTWWISVSCGDLQEMNYSCPPSANITVNNNNPTHNFIASTFVSTATLSGRLLDPAGAGLSGIQLIAFSSNSGTFRNGETGPDGSFNIPVNAGTWYLQISGNPPAGFLAPTLQFAVTDGNDINNIQLRVITADVTLSGTVKNSAGAALSGIRLYINGTVNNTNYNISQVTTTESGAFSVQVARGSWHINVDCDQVISLGYLCPFVNSIDTTSGNVQQNIVVSSPVTLTQANLLTPRVINTGGSTSFEFTISGNPGTYDIEGSASVPFTAGSWRTISTRTILAGASSIVVQFDPQENRFFRVVARQ